MLKVYGTKTCNNCKEVIAMLDEYNIDYVLIDILESQENLLEFLQIRDNNQDFNKYKEENKLGIPFFKYSDGTESFNFFLALVDRKKAN